MTEIKPCVCASVEKRMNFLMCSYDYHRGVDIPATLYSNVYAVADGIVRINGSHAAYSDGVVQVLRFLRK